MKKDQSIIHYRTTMSVFKKWFDQGIISTEEFHKIETIIARKYSIPINSIYR